MSSAVSIATSVSKRPSRLIPLATWRNDFSPYLGYAFYSSHNTPDRSTTGKAKTGDISSVRRLMSKCIPKEVSIDSSKAVERRLLAVLRRSRVNDSRVIVQHSYTGESVRPLDLHSIYCYTGAQLDDMFQIKNEHSGAAGSENFESRLGSFVEEPSAHQAKEESTGALDANMVTVSMPGESIFCDSYDLNVHQEKKQPSDAIWARQPYSLAQMVRLSCSTSSSMLLFSSQDAKDLSSPSSSPDPDSNRPTVSQLEAIQSYLNEYAKGFFVKVSDYRPCHLNIEFENNLFKKRIVTKGIAAYIIQLKKYVIIAHLKYINVRMHVLKITIDEVEGTVMVRWRVSGLPQAKIFQFWKFIPGRFMKNMNEQSEWFDGISTFYVGKDGLIHKHKADRVIPDKNAEVKQVSPLPELAGSA